MAKVTPPEPPLLTDQARTHKTAIVEDIDNSLRMIAEQIALAHKAENTLVPHINEALLTLKRSGLRPPEPAPWFFRRPDFRVGAGTLMVGLAPTFASVAKDVIESQGALRDHPFAMWTWMIAIPFVIFGVGVACATAGWMHRRSEV